MDLAIWFEREFPGGYPVALFPNLLARLHGTPARLNALTDELPADVLREAVDGRWSMLRNVGHLADLEELWHARLDDYEQERDQLAAADLQNRKTEEADHDEQELGVLLERFWLAREHTTRLIEPFGADELERVSHHPRLGTPMRCIDFLFFAAEHDDHHCARLLQLRHRATGP